MGMLSVELPGCELLLQRGRVQERSRQPSTRTLRIVSTSPSV